MLMETKFEQPASKGLIIAGYIFAILGGLIGIVIGAVKSTIKVDGEKKIKYDEASRKNGMYILFLAILMMIVFTAMKKIIP